MRRSALIWVLMASLGVFVPPVRPLAAADVEIIVRFGQTDPVSEFKNAQPPDAVTSFERLDTRSRIRVGVGVGAPTGHLMSFSTGGLIVEQGIRVEADLRQVFSLGRLTRVNGVSQGGEATAVDLQIAVTLVNPAGVDEPVVVTLPLGIAATDIVEFPDGTLWVTQIQVIFPAAFPSVEFTAGGAKYRLRLIGFGSVGPGGTVTRVSSLVDDPVQSADLLAVIEPPCPDPKDALSQFISDFEDCNLASLGPKQARYGMFKKRDFLEADNGDRLQLECVRSASGGSAFYRLMFTPGGSSEPRRVGRCPFDGGCNQVTFFHSGDRDNSGKPDCIYLTRWISKDYHTNDTDHFPHVNPWTDEFELFENLLDWAESVYDVTADKLTTRSYKFTYNFGPPVPFELCGKAGPRPESLNPVETTILLDPPLGPETEAFFDRVDAAFDRIPPSGVPMGEDRSKQCDFNGDGDCDAADLPIFEAALGSCVGTARYHPQADTDGSGCVDVQDRFHLFEQDLDGDGFADTADNCLTAANPDQIDSDGDGEGDACESGVVGDLDNDGDVDLDDLNIVLAARNTVASGPTDPRDLDRDDRITALDARRLVLLCTRPNCATQ